MGMLRCTGWQLVKEWKWRGEVNVSECLKIEQTARSGEAARQVAGGCEEKSDGCSMMVREKQAASRSPWWLGESGPIPSFRRWSGLCLNCC